VRVLISNDDGVHSPGLAALEGAARAMGFETYVVAPDREQSATSHSLTLHRPLRLHYLPNGFHAVDGTPTDCVNLAVLWLLRERRPDLIVSGINNGLNLGDDVTYSGTVSATFEGSLLGIPALAFSQEPGEGASFERAAAFARRFIGALLEDGLQPGLLLNVNIPAREYRGLAFTRLGRRIYQQVVVEKEDPRGRKYFWIAGTPEWQADEGTDHQALMQGLVSVTPLHLDLTDYARLAELAPLRDRLAARLAPPAAAP